jgi:hypothetical protein
VIHGHPPEKDLFLTGPQHSGKTMFHAAVATALPDGMRAYSVCCPDCYRNVNALEVFCVIDGSTMRGPKGREAYLMARHMWRIPHIVIIQSPASVSRTWGRVSNLFWVPFREITETEHIPAVEMLEALRDEREAFVNSVSDLAW